MSTWVLLRGLMREQRHWGDFPAQLGMALPGATVITLDLPGNGARHRDDSDTSVAGMVESARASVRAAGVQGPVHVLALSLGAMVAVEWAARHPRELAGVVLVNTSMRPFSRFHQRLRWQNYPAILSMALRGGAARRERTILHLTSNGHAGDAALLARWEAIGATAPVSRMNALRQLWAAARYRAPATPPAVPMLVVASEGDRLVDPACSLTLAAAWNVACKLHSSAGHDLPLDESEWLVAIVAKWAGQQAQASSGT